MQRSEKFIFVDGFIDCLVMAKQKLITLSTRVTPMVRRVFEEVAERQGKNVCTLLRDIVHGYLVLQGFAETIKQTAQVEEQKKDAEG